MDQAYRAVSGRVSIMMLVYFTIPLVILCYGLKCIVVQQGKFMDAQTRGKWGRGGVIITVKGPPAVTAGWGYVCGALFWVLYPGRSTGETSLPVYVSRLLLSFASLILMFLMWHVAHGQRFGH